MYSDNNIMIIIFDLYRGRLPSPIVLFRKVFNIII
jgi:hypothetical protein